MRPRRILAFVVVVLIALAAWFLLYASQSKKSVLFYYGAAPEVPQGRVIVIFNPFRSRDSENTAHNLIRDLRTVDCQQNLRKLAGTESDPRVCAVMEDTHKASLVWRDDREQSRVLVYDIPERQAHLWIVFEKHESGFQVSSVSAAH